MERLTVRAPPPPAPADAWRLEHWHVAEGAAVRKLDRLATLVSARGARRPVLAPRTGTLVARRARADAPLDAARAPVADLEFCTHSVVFNGLCAVCGEEETLFSAAPHAASRQPVAYSAALSVTRTEAQSVSSRAARRLFEAHQLSLVLDLDHTLVHTTDDPRAAALLAHSPPDAVLSSVTSFALPSSRGGFRYPHVMHLKVRPNLNHFLETLRVKFNLHIYTMGSRLYADRVAKLIDPDNRFFGGRITSREDFPEGNCNQKNIQRLFPCDDSMALIVDDREDVWLSDSTQPYMPNLLRAQPYHFWVGMHEAYDRVAPPEHHNPTAHQLADKPSGGSTDNTQQPPAVQGTLTTNSDNTTTIGNGNDISNPNHRHANLDSPANDSPFQPTGLKVQQPEEADARHAEGGMESPNYSNDVAKNSPTAPEDTAITVLSPPQLELRPSQTVGPSEGTVGAATSEPEKQLSATNIHETDRTNAHDHETKESEQENGDTSARSIKPDGHSGEATNVEKFRSIAKGWWETDSSPKSRSHLLRLAQVLEDCHKEFFDRCKSRKAHNGVEAQSAGQQFQSPADVKEILSEFRKKVLAGCVLTFSGLKPRKDAPETVPEWNLALRLGASCSSEFVHGRTTHVITSLKRAPDTQKCMDAMHSGTAYVVTTDWVEDCALNFERQNELAYCESAQQMFDDGEKFRDYVETRREKAAQALRKRGREELDEIYGNEVVGTIPWKKSRVSEEMDVMDDTGLEGTNGTAAVRVLSHDEIGEVMEDLFVE